MLGISEEKIKLFAIGLDLGQLDGIDINCQNVHHVINLIFGVSGSGKTVLVSTLGDLYGLCKDFDTCYVQ